MDFLNQLAGALKPVMNAVGVEGDENFQFLSGKGELQRLKGQRQELLAQLGDIYRQSIAAGQAPLAGTTDILDKLSQLEANIQTQEASLNEAERSLQEKAKEEEAARAAHTCPSCGEEFPDGTKFCQSCGTKLGLPQGRQCPSCGAECTLEVKFCGSCGGRLPE